MVKNVKCLIYYDKPEYDWLARCASESFSFYHPKIECIVVNNKNVDKFIKRDSQLWESATVGLKRYLIAYNLLDKGAERVISLGADTITCGFLDEFLTYKEDILCSLDYPYQYSFGSVYTPIVHGEHTHVNADVVCFTNKQALEKLISLYFAYHTRDQYYEQGALNHLIHTSKEVSHRIVDFPYYNTNVLYNVRSKGNKCDFTGEKPWIKDIKNYIVKENELFTSDGKNIKVFHYCEGIGQFNGKRFSQEVERLVNCFNLETKKYFNKICDTQGFL